MKKLITPVFVLILLLFTVSIAKADYCTGTELFGTARGPNNSIVYSKVEIYFEGVTAFDYESIDTSVTGEYSYIAPECASEVWVLPVKTEHGLYGFWTPNVAIFELDDNDPKENNFVWTFS